MEGKALPGGYQYPPGFRFHPTDQELILHYLAKKVTATLPPTSSIIADIDLYKFNPWDLPDKALFGEREWFFFSPRERKYPNGARPNRAAGCGYWKATGTDKPILATGGTQCIGVKKALVFYTGHPPKGVKTEWVMHEYRLLDGSTCWSQKHKGTMKLDDWVMCRVRQRGSFAVLQGEERSETPELSHHFTVERPGNPPAVGDADNTCKWADYQLLSYLMGSGEESRSAAQNSEGSSGGVFDVNGGACAVFDGSNRTLSFGELDEVVLLPPAKGLSFSCTVGEQLSPSHSFSVDQVYLD